MRQPWLYGWWLRQVEKIYKIKQKPPEPRIALLCMRLDEMFWVHPEQITLDCSKCGQQCGVYPSGQRVIAQHGDRVDILCNHCEPIGVLHQPAPGATTEWRQSQWHE